MTSVHIENLTKQLTLAKEYERICQEVVTANAARIESLQRELEAIRVVQERAMWDLSEAKKAVGGLAERIDAHSPPAPLPAPVKKSLPFISLLNNDGRWEENWFKCFDREGLVAEGQVCVGDTGSIGTGYWVTRPLDTLITDNDAESVENIMKTKPTLGHCEDSNGKKVHAPAVRWEKVGKEVSRESIKSVVKFYRLSQMPNGTLFGLKRGTKALWVVEKTGNYYFSPYVEDKHIPVKNKWQHTENYFIHRFSFRVVKVVPLTESQMVHHLQLIKDHEVTV